MANDVEGSAADPEAGGSRTVEVAEWQLSGSGARIVERSDRIAVESAVALVYNGISHVVMMATPMDLEDFALGFSLSEGILDHEGQLYDMELRTAEQGIEIVMEIAAQPFNSLKNRRRNLVGRTGCGLCGAESLRQVAQPLAKVADSVRLTHQAIQRAHVALISEQPLQAATGAAHGAAWCSVQGEVLLLREDVGRHNALDKLLGAKHKAGIDNEGFVLITSRASYEMAAKAAVAGIEVVAAVSAPTSLAIDLAEKSGVTLLGFCRPGRQVVYTGRHRLRGE